MSEAIQPLTGPSVVPYHVALIMDGNGRWAQRRGLPRLAGHRAGSKAVRRCVEAAGRAGVSVLTLYAFSSDNWQRPAAEVRALMELLEDYLTKEARRCAKEGVRLNVIGRRDRLADSLVRAIEKAEAMTAQAGKLHLRIAVDYSARFAITHAAELLQPGQSVSYEDFQRLINRATHSPCEAPPVDLLVRTSGEQRLSDFMLWECAYSELVFTDVFWPDFDGAQFNAALDEYQRRNRRYGRVAEAS